MALTIVSGNFFLNGTILNPGSPAEGLLLNSRMVQATVDVSGQSETSNWNADANTAAIIAMLPTYKGFGLNGITVNFQGGNFEAGWGVSYDAGGWNANGTLRTAHADRMEALLDACVAEGIIPMVGLTYFRQDHILTDEAAVLDMVETAKTFLAPWKDDIIIEVSNEATAGLVSHDILAADRVHEIIDALEADGWIASASWNATHVPTTAQQGDGRVVLLHQNGLTLSGMASQRALAKSRFPGMPIVVNEDGVPERTASEAVVRMRANINDGVAWGFHDPVGYQWWDGTNMVTMDWDITSSLQVAVFDEFEVLSTPAVGGGPQFAIPDSTVAHGGWDDVGGVVSQSDLHLLLNEGVADADDDTTRARSPVGPSNATLEVGLSDVDDPDSLVDHVLRARFRLAVNDATIDATAALVQGTTVIASVTRQFVGGTDDVNWITVTHALTEAEADEITDYTDLRIRLIANQVGGANRRLQVTAAELEVPALVVADQFTSGSQIVQDSVSAEAVPEASGTVTAVAVVSAVGHQAPKAAGTVSAEGSLTAVGRQNAKAAGTVGAEGSLAAVGSQTPKAAGTVTANGTVNAVGRTVPKAAGTVGAVASLVAVGSTPATEAQASGTVVAVASVTGVGRQTPVAAGTIAVGGSLAAVGHRQPKAAGTVSAAGSLAGVGETPAVDTFTAGSNIVQAAVVEESAEASGTVQAVGQLSATGQATPKASGTVSAEGGLTGVGRAPALEAQASGTISAEASITAVGHADPKASGVVSTEGATTGVGHTTPKASGSVTAEASVTGVGSAPTSIPQASGTVSAVGGLSATGKTIPRASGSVAAVGSTTGVGHAVPKSIGKVTSTGRIVSVGRLVPYSSGVVEAIAVLHAVGRSEPLPFAPVIIRIPFGRQIVSVSVTKQQAATSVVRQTVKGEFNAHQI